MPEDDAQNENEIRTRARRAILKEIPVLTEGASSAQLLELAQAYAWAVSPMRTGGSS